jgi:4-hydroxy-2-oxoglutarate aldolase
MFTGIIPPVPTPFKQNGDLDTASLQHLISQLEPHVDGFLILGSNGEVPYLEETERLTVLEAAREAIPKTKPMIVGTGAESTRQTLERARIAALVGGDAALVIAPFYNKGSMTPAVLEAHFAAVADDARIPVYVYNIPQVSGIAHAPAWMAKMSQHPNVSGVKDSSGDIMNFTEMARLAAPGFNLMTGNAPTLLPALSVGAHGAILAAANVIPRAFGALFKAFGAGDLKTALEIQRRSNPVAYAVTRDYGVSGLKAIMRQIGFSAGYPRAPLPDVDAATEKKLEALLLEIPDFI